MTTKWLTKNYSSLVDRRFEAVNPHKYRNASGSGIDMSRKSVLVISNSTSEEIDVTGDPVRIDNLYSSSEYMITTSITASAFMGRVILEGSIKNNPGEDDWFTLPLTDVGYVDYPRTGCTGRESSTRGFTIRGRYVWVRAKIIRSHLLACTATTIQIASYGVIDRILMNL